MTRYAATLATLTLAAGAASAQVKTEVVEYEHAGTKLKGVLAYDPTVSVTRPGVIVFPEWWGLNDYAKDRAKQLAGMGYVAFAADLYGDGKVIDIAHPDDAKKMAGFLRANQDVWRGRAEAAVKQLTSRPFVDAKKIAAIGYCLGGSTALQLAYTGADLKAVATFHAALPTPTAADADFKAALTGAKKSLDFVGYPGVVHSFTVPTADKVGNPGMRYDKTADEDSWRRMSALFRQELGR